MERTIQQNRAYWGVWLKYLSLHTGFTENELHARFKEMFIPSYENLCTGDTEDVTTRSLTTAEFSRYLDQIHIYSAERLNVHLPELTHAT